MSYYDILNSTPVNLCPNLKKKFGVKSSVVIQRKRKNKRGFYRVNKRVGMFLNVRSKYPIKEFNTCYQGAAYVQGKPVCLYNMLKKYAFTNAYGHIWRYLDDNGKILKSDLPSPNIRVSLKVRQIDLINGEEKIWTNANRACNSLGFSRSYVYKALTGERKSAYGFKWEYIHSYL